MASVLLDTHVWAWSLYAPGKLSPVARQAIEAAEVVYVSPATFFEIGRKVRLGKWSRMAPFVDELPDLLARQGALSATLDADTCLRAGTMTWDHRDPFDRVLASTSLGSGTPLVSADGTFDALSTTRGWHPRIW